MSRPVKRKVECSSGRPIRPPMRMVDTTLLVSRQGVRPERPATDPVPRRAQNMRYRRLNGRCRFPVRTRVSNATGVAAAAEADPSCRRRRDCVCRSDAASALQDGPKFFQKVPDDVVLHPEVRERLVCLLAKGQQLALVPHHQLVQGIEAREDPTQLGFDGVKAGVRCARNDLARRIGQRGANGFRVLGHNRIRLRRPCRCGDRLVVGAVPRDRLRQPLLEVRRCSEAEALECSSGVQPSTRLSVRL